MVDPGAIAPDPAVFGIALVDAIRHGAKAYAQAVGVSEEHALERPVLDPFERPRGHDDYHGNGRGQARKIAERHVFREWGQPPTTQHPL